MPVVEALPLGMGVLREVGFTVRVECPAIDFGKLQVDVGALAGALRRDDGRGLRYTVNEMGFGGPVHSHVTIEDSDEDDNDVEVRYDLYAGAHTSEEEDRDLVTPAVLFGQLAHFVPQLRGTLRGVLSGSFRFPVSEWDSAMQLPLELPKSVLPVQGKATISGLDFAFEDPSADQPLLRAFVAHYDSLEEIAVRVMMRFDVTIGERLSAQMVASAYEEALQFVRTRVEAP